MSSGGVRAAIKAAFAAQFPTLKAYDLSDYVSLSDLPNTVDNEHYVVLQFIGGSDDVVSIGGEGNQGWLESGVVAIHLMGQTGFDSAPVIALGDQIRLAMRGRRLGDVLVESVTTFEDQTGNSVNLDGGIHGWIAYLYYNRYECG